MPLVSAMACTISKEASMQDPTRMLERSYMRTGALIDGITLEQLHAPTPCPEFDVSQLINHILQAIYFAGAMMYDEPIDIREVAASGPPDLMAGDHRATYERSTKRLLSAFREPGSFERTFDIPWLGQAPASVLLWFHMNEIVVHGWELARATGQPADVDVDIAEALYENMKERIGPEFRSAPLELDDDPYSMERSLHAGDGPFGAPVPVPEDAPAFERLLAYTGRAATWSPGQATP
jgi:uncharacterized protein (TIGR03086 family)